MNRRRPFSILLFIIVTVSLVATGTITTSPTKHAQAEDNITLVLSVPSLWEDTITPDLLAEFEAQNPGVDVYVTYSENSFFGFGPGMSDTTVDDRLDNTEDFVQTADVLYVDSSSLTAEDTQAGYFLDLSPLVMNDPNLDTNDFIPAVWQSYQWDNGIWALPLSTDVILLTYDPAAFDAAGLAYPNERWTVDDFANAARALTQYNADGTVATPGFSVLSGGNNVALFLRAVAGASLYDSTTMPNAPKLADPALEYALQVAYEMVQDGVVSASGGGRDESIPLRVEGINGYAARNFRPDEESTQTIRYASLLPGGVAGLSVQGFAVSAATQYPELSYALAEFLTSRQELASNFFSASPARYSMISAQEASAQNGDTGGQNGGANIGGPGDGPTVAIAVAGGDGGGGFAFSTGGGGQTVPDEIKPTFDQALNVALPTSEVRYASYLSSALTEMSSNGGDAASALQTIEAQAISDFQTAQARNGTVSLYVTPPPAEPTLAPGKIELTCAVNQGFMFRGPGGNDFFNQDVWDQVIADFTANDPDVGLVTLEAVNTTDLAALAEQYDCIILPSNVVADTDLSTILSLDPLLDTDTSFDRNDVIGSTLTQVQQDNKTWALPLAIEPQMLTYDTAQFADAGVPDPSSGWTIDAFVDALRMLKPYDTDPEPFQPDDPGGSSILMLIAAFGGLPIDYRTDPPTINFTDATTVDAIRQVLDLAKEGYIAYTTGNTIEVTIDAENPPAITSGSFNMFRRFGPDGAEGSTQDTTATALYPQGSQYGVLSYTVTTGYISATAQNPEATYRFLSMVSRNPQLFSGMPVRQSLLSDPEVMASQGAETVAVYQQLDALLRSPNTIVFPSITGGGGGALNFMQEYWLRQAFDNYVTNDADLEAELASAEQLTKAYMDCAAGIVLDTSITDPQQQRQQYAEQILACTTTVDPSFSLGG